MSQITGNKISTYFHNASLPRSYSNGINFGYGKVVRPLEITKCFSLDTSPNSITVHSISKTRQPIKNFANFTLFLSHHASFMAELTNIKQKMYPRGEDSMSPTSDSPSSSSSSGYLNIEQQLTIENFADEELHDFKGHFYLVTSHVLSKGYLSIFIIKQIAHWWYMNFGHVITKKDVQVIANAFTKAESDSQKDLEYRIKQNFKKHFDKYGADATLPKWTKHFSNGQTELAAIFAQYLQTFTFKILHNVTTTGKFCSIDLNPNSELYSDNSLSPQDTKLVEMVGFGAYINLEFQVNHLTFALRLYLDREKLRTKFGHDITICYHQSSFFKSLLTLPFFETLSQLLQPYFDENKSLGTVPNPSVLHDLFISDSSSLVVVDLGCARQLMTLDGDRNISYSLPFVDNGYEDPHLSHHDSSEVKTVTLMGDHNSNEIFRYNGYPYKISQIISHVTLPRELADTIVKYDSHAVDNINMMIGFNSGHTVRSGYSHSHSSS